MSITLDQKINLKSILKIDEKKASEIISDINQDTIKIILENKFYDINRYSIMRYTRENDLESIFEIFYQYDISVIRDHRMKKVKQKSTFTNNEINEKNYSTNGAYSCFDY